MIKLFAKPLLFLIAALVAVPVFAQIETIPAPTDTLRLTLKRAIELGRERNYGVRLAASRINQSEARANETNAAMLPSLKFSGGYTRLSEVERIDDPIRSRFFPAIYDNYVARFTVQQTIYTGGRLSGARDIALLNEEAARFDYSRDSAQMELDIANSFWSVYRAEENYRSLLQNLEQIRGHLTDVQNFKNAGLATENDVLKVKVQLANAQLSLIDAQNSVDISRLGLASSIGLDVTKPVGIIREDISESEILLPLNSYVAQAREARPEIRAIVIREQASKKAVDIAGAGWLPQVSAVANYNYLNPNNRVQPVQPSFKGTWDAGIAINYDIWTWFTPRYQTQQAQETYEQTRLQKNQLIEAATLEVTSNYLQASRAAERIAVARQTVAQAEENYRVTNERFRSGVALSSELLDAETALLIARINLTTAIADWRTALARLSKSVGK